MTKTFLVTIAALFASVVTAAAQNMDAESTIPVILSSLPLVQLMGGGNGIFIQQQILKITNYQHE